tara:strand:+ start:717 stop:905 length:189 start_codon:yes stop_codon:yes gene_type:complete
MADAFNEAWGIVKFDWSGRKCKDCGAELSDEDFDGHGSWNYTCPECGTSYKHGDDDPYEQNW